MITEAETGSTQSYNQLVILIAEVKTSLIAILILLSTIYCTPKENLNHTEDLKAVTVITFKHF